MERSEGSPAVLAVDDHPLFLRGFVAAWSRERPGDRLLEASSFGEAKRIIDAVALTLVVTDLRLPDGTGIDVCNYVVATRPTVPVALLTTYDAPAIIEASRCAGARGFFSKDVDVSELLQGIQRLVSTRGLSSFPDHAVVPQFTRREGQVLRLLLDGASNPMIAAALGVSPETAKTHVTSVMGKLGASDRFSAASMARSWGFDLALPYLGEDKSKSVGHDVH